MRLLPVTTVLLAASHQQAAEQHMYLGSGYNYPTCASVTLNGRHPIHVYAGSGQRGWEKIRRADGPINRREWLGGMLNYYCSEAA